MKHWKYFRDWLVKRKLRRRQFWRDYRLTMLYLQSDKSCWTTDIINGKLYEVSRNNPYIKVWLANELYGFSFEINNHYYGGVTMWSSFLGRFLITGWRSRMFDVATDLGRSSYVFDRFKQYRDQ